MVCASCGREYGDWELSCPSCGAFPGDGPRQPQPQAGAATVVAATSGDTARCPHCGSPVEQWASHCPGCGAEVIVGTDGLALRNAQGVGWQAARQRKRRPPKWLLLLLLPCLLPCLLPLVGRLLSYRLVEHLPYPGAMAHNRTNKPGMVVVVIDVSYSMAGGKLDSAIRGAQQFIDALDDQDYVQVIAFSDLAQPLHDFTQVGPNRATIQQQTGSLTVQGGTNIFGALDAAILSLRGGDSQQFFKAVVFLSDGIDPAAPHPSDVAMSTDAHIYAICYGFDADVQYLTELARATSGWCVSGNEVNLARAYKKIASIF